EAPVVPAPERVRSTLRQWLAESPGTDECTRQLLLLGSAAVAAIRDPAQWPAFEPLISRDAVADAWLTICGAPAAERWSFSLRRLFATRARHWLRHHWRQCWDSLSDATKRHLVEDFAEEAMRMNAEARGVGELPRLLTEVLRRFQR